MIVLVVIFRRRTYSKSVSLKIILLVFNELTNSPASVTENTQRNRL
jgi:general stress protein CsbA